MEKIKICTNSFRNLETVLNVSGVTKSGDTITIYLSNKTQDAIKIGDDITVMRHELYDDQYNVVAKKTTKVLAFENGNKITIEIPKRNDIIQIINKEHAETVLINGDEVTSVFDLQDEGQIIYYIFNFSERINVFNKDIEYCTEMCCPYEIKFYNLITDEEIEYIDVKPIFEQEGTYLAVALTKDARYEIYNDGAYIKINQNEFYFTNNDSKITFWDNILQNTKVGVYYFENTITIPLNVAAQTDAERLYMESNVDGLYSNIKDSIIPEVIDYEKVQFKPIIMADNKTMEEVSSLLINLHFRPRKKKIIGDEFEDGWYIDSDVTKYWRGYDSYEDIGDDEALDSRSDNLCELDFTDDDVKYRKNRLKKSFLRLSFYNSKDLFSQSLLFYSNIFVDAAELCGKYIRLKSMDAYKDDNELVKNYDVPEKYRLSTQFKITDEYDTTRSAEGFNIYLFSDDVPTIENSSRTIYMKVEFNHAKYGRTLPFIQWPIVDGAPQPLYVKDYLDASYMEVEIKYDSTNNRYLYSIPSAINKDGIIKLNLFEPIITPLADE